MNRNSSIWQYLRRTICFALALLLLFSVPSTVLAATYTASNAEEMESSWAAASSNEDDYNFIEITNDIDLSGTTLVAETHKWYYVESQDDADYELSNVRIDGGDDGGVVYIKTDVTSEEGAALTVGGDVVVNVIGDVSTTSQETDDGNNPVIEVYDDASVTVNGDVTAAEAGIIVSDSRITVTGDVTLTSEGDDYNNFVIDAYNSTVTVNGDVQTEELGILAMEESDVTINGDVELISKDEVDMHNAALTSNSDSKIYVTGDVTSEEGGLTANDARIIVDGNVDVEGQSAFVSDSIGLIKGSYTATPSEDNLDPNNGVWV